MVKILISLFLQYSISLNAKSKYFLLAKSLLICCPIPEICIKSFGLQVQAASADPKNWIIFRAVKSPIPF